MVASTPQGEEEGKGNTEVIELLPQEEEGEGGKAMEREEGGPSPP